MRDCAGRQFLGEMQAAGRGDQFRGQMRTEIAQRVAQLKRLDALITDRDHDLLHDSDGSGDGVSGAGGGGAVHQCPRTSEG